jgi:hypothetical protein
LAATFNPTIGKHLNKKMRIGDQVRCSIDDFENGSKFESALLHATTAIDGTAGKIFGHQNGQNKANYLKCLRQYYWLIEPMLGSINFVDTRFTWGKVVKKDKPDLADIIYEAFRCAHAHGSEHPLEFSTIECVGTDKTIFRFEEGKIGLPDRIVFALLSVAILSTVNSDQRLPNGYYFSLGDEKFIINEWWGRENDFKNIAEKYNKTRLLLNFEEQSNS